jgi:hypothetical protein
MKDQTKITLVDIDDKERILANSKEILDGLKSIEPENLRCLLFCAVDTNNMVHTGVLGSDVDIAKMLVTVAIAARGGIDAAKETESTNDNKKEMH